MGGGDALGALGHLLCLCFQPGLNIGLWASGQAGPRAERGQPTASAFSLGLNPHALSAVGWTHLPRGKVSDGLLSLERGLWRVQPLPFVGSSGVRVDQGRDRTRRGSNRKCLAAFGQLAGGGKSLPARGLPNAVMCDHHPEGEAESDRGAHMGSDVTQKHDGESLGHRTPSFGVFIAPVLILPVASKCGVQLRDDVKSMNSN